MTSPAGSARVPWAAVYGAAAFAVVLWGANPAVTKIAVGGLPGATVGVGRMLLAGLLALPVILLFRLPPPRAAGDWGLLLAAALGGFVGFPLLFSLGMAKTATSHGALINAAIPVFTGLFGLVAARRWPSGRWTAGMALAVAGEALLILGRGDSGGGSGGVGATLAGDLVCMASSACAGLSYVAGSRLSARIGVWPTTFWAIGLGGVLMAPALLWPAVTLPATVPPSAWAAVAYLAVAGSIVGYVAWYWALMTGGVVRVSPMQFAMPVVSLALAVALFADRLTLMLLASAALVLAGIAIARKG